MKLFRDNYLTDGIIRYFFWLRCSVKKNSKSLRGDVIREGLEIFTKQWSNKIRRIWVFV